MIDYDTLTALAEIILFITLMAVFVIFINDKGGDEQ